MCRLDLNRAHLVTVFSYQNLPASIVKVGSTELSRVGSAATSSSDSKVACQDLLSILRERHPVIVEAVLSSNTSQPSVNEDVDEGPIGNAATSFVNVYSADVAARVKGVQAMAKILTPTGERKFSPSPDAQSAIEALAVRLGDNDEAVVSSVYQNSAVLYLALGKGDRYIKAVAPVFMNSMIDRAILHCHLKYMSDESYTADNGFERKAFDRLLFPCLVHTSQRQAFMEEDWSIILNGQLGKLDVLASIKPDVDRLWNDGSDQHNYYAVLVRGLAGLSL